MRSFVENKSKNKKQDRIEKNVFCFTAYYFKSVLSDIFIKNKYNAVNQTLIDRNQWKFITSNVFNDRTRNVMFESQRSF